MAGFLNAFVRFTAQHVNDVLCGKALLQSKNTAEHHLCRHQSIERTGRIQTDITVTTGFVTELRKVVQQYLTTAGLCFRERFHGTELLEFNRIALGIFALVNPLLHPCTVFFVEQQHGFRRQTVTPGPAGFLIIALNASRHVMVNNVADVGFIDTHTKSDRGNHNVDFIGNKLPLNKGAFICLHTRVIGRATHALAVKLGV